VSRWHITSVKRVMMTYYFTGESDDDILLHWRVS